MKRIVYFILLCILVLPLGVFAKEDVEITKIERIDKSDSSEELKEATFEGLKLNFNVKFSVVNDYIKYKVTLKNSSNKDYEVEMGNTFDEKEYIRYDFSFDGDSKVLKGNSEKVIYVTLTYTKEVPSTELVDGKYEEDNSMVINLSYGEEDNPETGGLIYGVLALIVLFGIVFVLSSTIYKAKNNSIPMYIIIGLLLIPITIYALEKITIDVDTHIEIQKSGQFCVFNYDKNDIFDDNVHFNRSQEKELDEYLINYDFDYGMTFGEYFTANPQSDMLYKNDHDDYFYYRKLRLCDDKSYCSFNNGYSNYFYFLKKGCHFTDIYIDGTSEEFSLDQCFEKVDNVNLSSVIKDKSVGCYYTGFDDGYR